MKLSVTDRASRTKSELHQIRREGNIPAIVYSKGEKGREIVIDGNTFKKGLNGIEPGTLSSQIFTIEGDGKGRRAILKDIQYHPVTYDILHLDFAELHEGTPVTLNIPIKCLNVADCAGVKLGGTFRQITRSLRVRVETPKDIPSHFEVDVQDLGLGQSLRLRDVVLPKGVRPLIDLKEVVVVVSRR